MSVLRERKHLALLAVLLVAAIMEPLVADADVIAWRLGDWHLQRFYFNYYSVTTLTSLGYSDITPVGTITLSLSWLEVVFGQVLHRGRSCAARRVAPRAVDEASVNARECIVASKNRAT